MPDTPIDYRALLWRYMHHVMREEGVSFLKTLDADEFSSAEIEALDDLEVLDEPPSADV